MNTNFCKYWVGVLILLLLSPLYINIFIIYSMCNLHDISWEDRGSQSNIANRNRDTLEQFRTIYLILWISCNTVYGYTMTSFGSTVESIYILSITGLVSLIVIIKIICSIIHVIYDCFSRLKGKKTDVNLESENNDDDHANVDEANDIEESKNNNERLHTTPNNINESHKNSSRSDCESLQKDNFPQLGPQNVRLADFDEEDDS